MNTQLIWLSFDLGVKGDYEGMYRWLDAHEAKECGDSVAYLKYNFESDLIENLTQELTKDIQVTPRTRVYVIWRNLEHKSFSGRFIIGGRKAPPWAGFANTGEHAESDES